MAETNLRALLSSDTLLLAVVMFLGVAGSGVAAWGFRQLGLPRLGDLLYIAGYGGMVFVVWYGWIRPLDLTGPE